MIISLLKYKYRVTWIIFHVLLGFAAVLNSAFVITWFYFTLAGTFYLLSVKSLNRPLILAGTMAYIGAFELLARMTKCSPVIPWEASKYVFALLSIAGIYFSNEMPRKKLTGWLIILFALPAVFIDMSERVTVNEIIFNVMGIINIGLGLLFFSSLKVTKERFIDMIRLMIYPCITILTYTIIKTPDLNDINFSLGAQVATSGEFGSNQVSTVLGLGFLLMSLSWIMNWKITSSRLMDGLLACAFLIQGLFTFSRGGMVSAAFSLILFVYILFFKSGSKAAIPQAVKRYALPVFIVFIMAVVYANSLTGGKLFLRYQGETEGTLIGDRERDLTTFTTNRNLVFLEDIQLWSEYPIFGVGAGSSKYLRGEGRGIAAHIEFSRLLSEHGLPGLIIFLLILAAGYGYLKETDPVVKAIKITLFCLAILTTFHSATRTFVSPLLLSLCATVVLSNVKPYDPVPGK